MRSTTKRAIREALEVAGKLFESQQREIEWEAYFLMKNVVKTLADEKLDEKGKRELILQETESSRHYHIDKGEL